jgi:phenylacetate-CoA ligase
MGVSMQRQLVFGCSMRQVTAKDSPAYSRSTLHRACRAPWYRDRLAPARVPAADLELTDFPILARDELREHADEFLTGLVPRPLRRRVTTSGSTGSPVRLWLDRSISLSEWRFLTHQWATVGFRRGDWRLRLHGPLRRRRDRGRLAPRFDRLRREISLASFDLNRRSLPRYLEIMQGSGAPFLHTFPSTAIRLAQLCAEEERPVPRFRGVLIGSESVSPEQRDWLTSTYGCPVYSWYGQTEKILLGGECPRSRDYHLFPGYGAAEIVDDHGLRIVQPGVFGRLVGTGFLNLSAPLVRYDTGDRAAWAAGECACGWPGQRLSSIIGRTHEYLLTPEGNQVSVAALTLESDLIGEVRQLQYVQDRTDRVVVRVVPGAKWSPARQTALLELLEPMLPGCSVSVETVRFIEVGPNGKAPLILRR